MDWLLRQLLGWLLIWPALDDDIAAMTVPVVAALTAAVLEASMMTAEVPGVAATVAAMIGCFGFLYSCFDSSCGSFSDSCYGACCIGLYSVNCTNG
jgi:hypothetical protein